MRKSMISTQTKMAAVLALAGFFGTMSTASAGTDLENLDWVERGPVKIVMLWGGPEGESAFLLKNSAGYKGREHLHNEDYQGVTLQGIWVKTLADDSVIEIPVGSHFMQPKEEWHIDGCAGPEDCILFIHFEGTRDIVFSEE